LQRVLRARVSSHRGARMGMQLVLLICSLAARAAPRDDSVARVKWVDVRADTVEAPRRRAGPRASSRRDVVASESRRLRATMWMGIGHPFGSTEIGGGAKLAASAANASASSAKRAASR